MATPYFNVITVLLNTVDVSKSTNDGFTEYIGILSDNPFLIVVPVMVVTFDAIYGWLRDGFIPPLGESITKYTFFQFVTTLIFFNTNGATGDLVNTGLICVFVVFGIAALYICFFRFQKKRTTRHIRNMLSCKKHSLKNNDILIFRDLAEILIVPDYLENSIANKMSDNKRMQARQLFIRLLKAYANAGSIGKCEPEKCDLEIGNSKNCDLKDSGLRECDLLVPGRAKSWSKYIGFALIVSAVLALAYSINYNKNFISTPKKDDKSSSQQETIPSKSSQIQVFENPQDVVGSNPPTP